MEKPLPVPGFGLVKTPLWRSGVYGALYQPARAFALLASVAAEIYNNASGPGFQSYVEFVNNASSPIEPPLVDITTGLKNTPNIIFTIVCSDGGGRLEETGMSKAEAVFNRYQGVSQYFGGLSSQIEIICLGICNRHLQLYLTILMFLSIGAGLPAKERITGR